MLAHSVFGVTPARLLGLACVIAAVSCQASSPKDDDDEASQGGASANEAGAGGQPNNDTVGAEGDAATGGAAGPGGSGGALGDGGTGAIATGGAGGNTGGNTGGHANAPGGQAGQAPANAIIDTHTHFYDPQRPKPPGRATAIPWPGAGSPLYKTILPPNYLSLAKPLGMTGTVVVEASGWLEDNDWILSLAQTEKAIVGFVGNLGEVWSDATKFSQALTKYKANPLFRGIRVGASQVGPAVNQAQRLDNFKQLAAADLMVDVLGVSFADIDKLAAAVPALRIVVDHMGPGFSPKTPADPTWANGIQLVAQRPNVFLKISYLVEGTGSKDGNAPANLQHYEAALDVVWAAFGEDRLVYGSNWPVSEPAAPLSTVHAIAKAYLESKGAAAQAKVFAGNALRIYKWVQRP